MNSRGAVAWTIWRHIPRGNRTRSPSTSAPASWSSSSASGSPRNSRPTSSRIVSAFCSIVARPSSSSTSNGCERPGQERHALDVACGAERPCRPARPPVRWRGRSVGHRSSLVAAHGRAGVCAGGSSAPSPAQRRRRSRRRARSTLREVRIGGGPMRERHRLDEVLLEARLDGGLDLLDASGRRPRSRAGRRR